MGPCALEQHPHLTPGRRWPRWEEQVQGDASYSGSRERGWEHHSITKATVDLSLPAHANSPGSEEGADASGRPGWGQRGWLSPGRGALIC